MTTDSTTVTAIVTEEGKVRRAILQRQADGQYVEIDSSPLLPEYSVAGYGKLAASPAGGATILLTAPQGTA